MFQKMLQGGSGGGAKALPILKVQSYQNANYNQWHELFLDTKGKNKIKLDSTAYQTNNEYAMFIMIGLTENQYNSLSINIDVTTIGTVIKYINEVKTADLSGEYDISSYDVVCIEQINILGGGNYTIMDVGKIELL